MILQAVVGREIWIFVGEVRVVSPTQIEGIGVGVILWSIIEVVEGIG